MTDRQGIDPDDRSECVYLDHDNDEFRGKPRR